MLYLQSIKNIYKKILMLNVILIIFLPKFTKHNTKNTKNNFKIILNIVIILL